MSTRYRAKTKDISLPFPRGDDIRSYSMPPLITEWSASIPSCWSTITDMIAISLTTWLRSDSYIKSGPFDKSKVEYISAQGSAIFGPNRIEYNAKTGKVEVDFVFKWMQLFPNESNPTPGYTPVERKHTAYIPLVFEEYSEPKVSEPEAPVTPPKKDEPLPPKPPVVSPPKKDVVVVDSNSGSIPPLETSVVQEGAEVDLLKNVTGWFQKLNAESKQVVLVGGVFVLLLLLR